MTSRTKAQKAGKSRPRERRTAAKRSGIVRDLSGAAEPLSIYAGNSARKDEALDAMETQRAFERADKWARSTTNEPYGGD